MIFYCLNVEKFAFCLQRGRGGGGGGRQFAHSKKRIMPSNY